MKRRPLVSGIVLATVAMAIGGAAFVYSGVYDISAVDQHTKPVYWLIEFSMRRAVAVRAKDTKVPDLSGAETIERGFALYHANCAQCHGAPGLSPQRAALGMMPVPAYLVRTAREWDAARLHWVIENGIKMTGMPAWKHRMSDDEIWQIVAFLKQRLPQLSAQAYADAAANLQARPVAPTADAEARAPGMALGAADAVAGKHAMDQYGCPTCHVIPEVTAATKQIGPPLTGMASRSYIAGALENTPANMVRWLKSPPRVKPGTAMPDLGLSDRDARDMAAYLATLKD